MKGKAIKFFTPQENSPKVESPKSKQKPSGYISGTGKIVLPSATMTELNIQAENTNFRIGTDQGKRKIKTIYLVPSEEGSGAFPLVKSGRGYVIPLALILKQGGVDFETAKYTFTVSEFEYEDGISGYALSLESAVPQPAPSGKRRGRKPKNAESAA